MQDRDAFATTSCNSRDLVNRFGICPMRSEERNSCASSMKMLRRNGGPTCRHGGPPLRARDTLRHITSACSIRSAPR